ncbi:ABC transporter ATP-binding protein/permease [Spiroplasma gladiatoris]|uniref:ABC transporter ATP-binding protein/permease n=1 Tax=Spiroplasma gladiatoris TaxID=2143 RepID=A0A4P7AHB8_9MOLU|nr:ABC transporter ATP-binding protein [Spiroplasma gladiatoris]QBQ07521.1 ABC transporter ATP-binding protein/permease [Spiroplasma gladiatoris]
MKYEQGAKSKIMDKIQSEKSQIGYLKMLFRYFKRHPFFGVWIFSLAIITSGIAVSLPLVMQEMITCLQGIDDKITSSFLGFQFGWEQWMYLQIGMYVVLAFTVFNLYLAVGKLGKRVEVHLRNQTVKSLLLQDISYYTDQKIGEILTRIAQDTQIIGDQTQLIPTLGLMAIFNFLGSAIVLTHIDLRLGLISFAFVLLGVSSIFLFMSRVQKKMMQLRTVITYVNGDITDRVATMRLIKASGTEEYEKQRYSDIHNEFYDVVKMFFRRFSSILTSAFVAVMSVQLVIFTCAYVFYSDDTNRLIVVATSFAAGLGTMVSPIYQVLRISFGYLLANQCTKRVQLVITSKPRFDQHYYEGTGINLEHIDGDIIFEGVKFAYPEKLEQIILPKFDFKFEKGKSYAFVGETGSGKSTISRLLLRFYDPTEGRILINGNVNLKDIRLKSYLNRVGYVEQEPQIMFGTAKENIKYTNPEASDEEVIEAAKKANLHDLIMTWPLGYDTILGERGFMLSGGQKQRLVIARMFLKNPELLILDEATSALDNVIEKEIQVELEKLMVGRTSVSIAHRLSTIKNCDQIIVLAPGQGVVQMGTYEELKKIPGHFKNLYDAGLMKVDKKTVAL